MDYDKKSGFNYKVNDGRNNGCHRYVSEPGQTALRDNTGAMLQGVAGMRFTRPSATVINKMMHYVASPCRWLFFMRYYLPVQ